MTDHTEVITRCGWPLSTTLCCATHSSRPTSDGEALPPCKVGPIFLIPLDLRRAPACRTTCPGGRGRTVLCGNAIWWVYLKRGGEMNTRSRAALHEPQTLEIGRLVRCVSPGSFPGRTSSHNPGGDNPSTTSSPPSQQPPHVYGVCIGRNHPPVGGAVEHRACKGATISTSCIGRKSRLPACPPSTHRLCSCPLRGQGLVTRTQKQAHMPESAHLFILLLPRVTWGLSGIFPRQITSGTKRCCCAPMYTWLVGPGLVPPTPACAITYSVYTDIKKKLGFRSLNHQRLRGHTSCPSCPGRRRPCPS